MTFDEHLSSLVKGTRNNELVSLMLRGLGERKDDAQSVIDAIHYAQPDLTDAELRHAMESAQARRAADAGKTIPSAGSLRIERAVQYAEIVPKEDRDFVERTISRSGATSYADLMRMSPIDVSKATPREQAMAYVATVFPDDRYYVFTATEESKFHKRTFDTLRFPSILYKEILNGAAIPNYAIANQFTGAPNDYEKAISGDDFDKFKFTGDGSFACMKTLATRRLALLEFDDLPLADQARFWATAIREDLFDGRLRTLVFSGTKSIHALLRVDEPKIIVHHMETYEELAQGLKDVISKDDFIPENWKADLSDDPVSKWKVERGKLSRITEHSDNKIYRADKACKDPTRLTRFAGATRICKDGKRRIQRLLWCEEPDTNDIPTPDDGVQVTFQTEGFGLNGEYYQ